MRSGPDTASGYPGKFSTSDVSWSCAHCVRGARTYGEGMGAHTTQGKLPEGGCYTAALQGGGLMRLKVTSKKVAYFTAIQLQYRRSWC